MKAFWDGFAPVPLHQRPLKSTEFRSWYLEWTIDEEVDVRGERRKLMYDVYRGTAVNGKYHDDKSKRFGISDLIDPKHDEFCRWLFEDVPLRTYYKEAVNFAYLGYVADEAKRENVSDDEYGGYDYDGLFIGFDTELFRGLPNIHLFHGLGGYCRRDHGYADFSIFDY